MFTEAHQGGPMILFSFWGKPGPMRLTGVLAMAHWDFKAWLVTRTQYSSPKPNLVLRGQISSKLFTAPFWAYWDSINSALYIPIFERIRTSSFWADLLTPCKMADWSYLVLTGIYRALRTDCCFLELPGLIETMKISS